MLLMLHGIKTIFRRRVKCILIIACSCIAFWVIVRMAGKPDLTLLISMDLPWFLTGVGAIGGSFIYLMQRWYMVMHFFFIPPPRREIFPVYT